MEKQRTLCLLLRCCSSRSPLFRSTEGKGMGLLPALSSATTGEVIRRNCHRKSELYSGNHRSCSLARTHILQNFQKSPVICTPYELQYRRFGSSAAGVQRNPAFSSLTSEDICYFKEIIGGKNVIQDEDRLLSANMDWTRRYEGASKLLLQPKSAKEVSKILQYCNSRRLAVVPQGGNTGLVGGSVPVHDEIIINLGLMNKILSLDKVSGILVCEAGCILENLNSFLENEG